MTDRSDRPASGDERDRIADLEAQVEALSQELARARDRMHRLAAARQADATEIKGLTADLRRTTAARDRAEHERDRLRRRRAVRMALAASAAVGRLTGAVRRAVGRPRRAVRSARRRFRQRADDQGRRASASAERALTAAITHAAASPGPTTGPLVSIVIVSRDGGAHLVRCLDAIESTAYADLEVILVDNASTDGSAEAAERRAARLAIRVLRNAENRSFSEANAQGVSVANGHLVCFLNNDVEPITPHWLGYLVETLADRAAVAVGARLIYPRHRGGPRGGARYADLTLQHRGVAFDRTTAVPLPRVVGAGEDPLAPAATAIEARTGLTAACLLVDRQAFDAVGGFSTAYEYGLEDVDLALRLQAAGGTLVYDGRAALWHHESATRAADAERRRAQVTHNRAALIDRWAPRVYREVLLDALAGEARWSSAPIAAAIVVGPDGVAPVADAPGDVPPPVDERAVNDGLRARLAAIGWTTQRVNATDDGPLPDLAGFDVALIVDAGVDVRRLPRRVVTVALVDGAAEAWTDRAWFDDIDLVLVRDAATAARVRDATAKRPAIVAAPGSGSAVDAAWPDADALRTALADWVGAIRYGIRVGIPSHEVAETWGDYHFARGIQRALEGAGHPTRLHLAPDWDDPAVARDDVNLQLFGRTVGPIRSSQVNLLWQISHPELADAAGYERFDHVFVASDRFAARRAGRTTTPVTPLHQATDPARFRPDPSGPHHELLFVGNTRFVRRRIIDDLAGTTHDLAIYGLNWRPDLVDPRFVRGTSIPNRELARYYSSADIVLNDHWDDMRAEGFISNRIYDALACGAFVISDTVEGIEREFGGAVATYDTPAELEALVDRTLADPDARRRAGETGRAIVLERHTFDHRVATIREVASGLLDRRPPRIRAAPDVDATSRA